MATDSGKRSGLGRGLSALIAKTDLDGSTERPVEPNLDAGVQIVKVDDIAPNPHQPRTHFDETALDELAESIRKHGIIQPLIVTRSTDEHNPARYWLVTGERRWRAARIAGLQETPVIVREASARQLMEWALVENIQREDLNPLEEAAAFQSLMNEYCLTQAEVAERVGKSRSAVANTVRLLQLPVPVQTALLAQEISPGHARALLPLADHAKISSILDSIVANELSVRQTEALVRQWLQKEANEQDKAKADADPLVAHWRNLEDRFRSALGTRVNLNRNEDGSGRLIVHFYNDDDLDSLLQQIASDEE